MPTQSQSEPISYVFSRPLSNQEANLLILLIGWRRGSKVTATASRGVTGCTAFADDMLDFRTEMRKGRRPPLEIRESVSA